MDKTRIMPAMEVVMEKNILGGRYELIEKIGTGGMAFVYKARCKLLNRYVAVKVLRPDFVNDNEFIKRFSVEAQAAASLSHSNIVPIYDVGYEDGIYYIVMEYIDGITLKEYISRKKSLDWKEAVSIAVQICSAIEHAHKNHIVHRDIKPHNILLTKDGIAKVTDFGIAKAVTASTITLAGNTIGSVHYFSPEQARGGFIDEKSDLYSLGIVIYEMVTGKTPFDGESPVTVALKHIQDCPVEPKEIKSRIPSGINDIIVKAIQKEQRSRYQTAGQMLADLYKGFEKPDGKFVEKADDSKTLTTRMKGIFSKSEAGVKEELKIKGKNNMRRKKKKDSLSTGIAIMATVIILAIFAYVGYRVIAEYIIPSPSEFEVGNYVNRSINIVKDELKDKIDIEEVRAFSDDYDRDIIMEQSIAPGMPLKEGIHNVIELTVSDGPNIIELPDYKGQDYRDVETLLGQSNLGTEVKDEYSDTVGNAMVIRTEPAAGEKVRPGELVVIYKSTGPELEPVMVPDLTGANKDEARQMLDEAKLTMGKIFPEDVISDTAVITKQFPAADSEVDEGTAVDIYFEEKTGNQTEYTQPELERTMKEYQIPLMHPEDYDGDMVKVVVEATPSDTNRVMSVMNADWSKSSFPITVQVPVPIYGRTKVNILINNKSYKTEYIQP
jgi:eukaryotic-like serine/threonine-protein kinase